MSNINHILSLQSQKPPIFSEEFEEKLRELAYEETINSMLTSDNKFIEKFISQKIQLL